MMTHPANMIAFVKAHQLTNKQLTTAPTTNRPILLANDEPATELPSIQKPTSDVLMADVSHIGASGSSDLIVGDSSAGSSSSVSLKKRRIYGLTPQTTQIATDSNQGTISDEHSNATTTSMTDDDTSTATGVTVTNSSEDQKETEDPRLTEPTSTSPDSEHVHAGEKRKLHTIHEHFGEDADHEEADEEEALEHEVDEAGDLDEFAMEESIEEAVVDGVIEHLADQVEDEDEEGCPTKPAAVTVEEEKEANVETNTLDAEADYERSAGTFECNIRSNAAFNFGVKEMEKTIEQLKVKKLLELANTATTPIIPTGVEPIPSTSLFLTTPSLDQLKQAPSLLSVKKKVT